MRGEPVAGHGLRLTIADAKLTRYLLDLDSHDGRGKAMYFLAEGFTANTLRAALLAHGETHRLIPTKHTEWGTVIEARGPMALPRGGTANILSVWQIDRGAPGVARLLTAHLLPKTARSGEPDAVSDLGQHIA